MTLKECVLNEFSLYFDLTVYRQEQLNSMLDDFNGSNIDVNLFMSYFGLESYYQVLMFVLDGNNVERLISYGEKFQNNNGKDDNVLKYVPIIK